MCRSSNSTIPPISTATPDDVTLEKHKGNVKRRKLKPIETSGTCKIEINMNDPKTPC